MAAKNFWSLQWLPNLSRFCQLPINVFLTRYLPFCLSRLYLNLLTKIYFLFKPEEKKKIRRTLIHVWQEKMSARSLSQLVNKTFQGMALHYHEKLVIAYCRPRKVARFLKTKVKVSGDNLLPEAQRKGKGVILVTGHFGAVEFLPAVLGLRGYPVSIIYRAQTRCLAASLAQRAKLINLTLIDADEQGNVFMAAVKALKEGRILITECDEFDEWRRGSDNSQTFLGQRIGYDRTLDILQKRTGAPVITAFLHREENGGYHLYLSPITDYYNPNLGSVSARCLAVLDKAIQEAPHQWYQWKKFAPLLAAHQETAHAHHQGGYLAPEAALPHALQA